MFSAVRNRRSCLFGKDRRVRTRSPDPTGASERFTRCVVFSLTKNRTQESLRQIGGERRRLLISTEREQALWRSCLNQIFGQHTSIYCLRVDLTLLSSPEEAGDYVRTLQSLLRAVGSSDGNMEAVSPFARGMRSCLTSSQGSLRCDVNVSVSRPGEPFGTRCEIKNLNSVKFMMMAIG